MSRMRIVPKEREQPQTDAALFVTIATGDLGPLGVLFDRYHEDVRQFFVRAAPRGDDHDDLVQETFLTAARAAKNYDGRPVAKPFLIGVAAQLLRRRRRTFARLRARLDAWTHIFADSPRTPEETASTNENHAKLLNAIERLSDDRRIVLVMVEWNGMSGTEVAEVLGVPVGTVWRRLHEARKELRNTLGEQNS